MTLQQRTLIPSVTVACVTFCLAVGSPRSPSRSGHQPPREETADIGDPADGSPSVNSLAHDRNVWHELLTANTRIRRTVWHTESGVRAITESDDPAVAAKIIEHARAMQSRMKVGARVRVWDPVFSDLFKKHGHVLIQVTPTAKGVEIVESSADAEAVELLRSHAMGVSEFVREGFKAAPRETPRFKSTGPAGSLPAPELSIGGVRHRFILAQPDSPQLECLKAGGVDVIIDFRKPAEHPDFGEQSAVAQAGMAYCNPAYGGATELTDQVLDAARAAIRSAEDKGETAALHCRTGNRVGPGWAAYRAIDSGVPLEQAIGEARAMQMLDPLMESKTRDYIRRNSAKPEAWTATTRDALSAAQQSQLDQAIAARDEVFSRLFAALKEAMARPGSEGGAAGAIGVCKEEAPRIAQAVSREKGVLIGRTNAKLRNPANAAPTWAESLVAGQQPLANDPRLAASTDGSLGVTLPIRLMAACVTCHGDRAAIDPTVINALAANYPKDEATGFKEGDLRGWFWIEVPPTKSR